MLDEPDMHDEAFWTRYLRRQSVVCPKCRYSLTGGRSPICPECAHIATLHELRLTEDPTIEQWYTSGAWALTSATVLGFIPGVVLAAFSIGKLFDQSTFVATRSDAVFLLIASMLMLIVLPALAFAWRRYVLVIARLPAFLRWLIVGVCTAMAVAVGLGILAVLAVVGLSIAR